MSPIKCCWKRLGKPRVNSTGSSTALVSSCCKKQSKTLGNRSRMKSDRSLSQTSRIVGLDHQPRA